MSSLVASRVSRSYGAETVVSDVSLELTPNKLTALLGGSGAGKSTLLRLFAGLEPVESGEILIGDKVLSTKDHTLPAEKRRVGLVFQDFALFPHLSAEQNVCFGLKHLLREDAHALARRWLDRLGLSARATAYPHQLSGGEQQRVSIARALAPEPAAILLDEPFSGLDPALREGVRDLALSAVQDAGIPALLVTHDADEAMAYADHLAVMRGGKIVQQGTPRDVYRTPADYETAAALGPVNFVSAKSSLANILGESSGVREEGVLLDANGAVGGIVKRLRHVGPVVSLEIDVEGHGILKAKIPGADASVGDAVTLSFNSELCMKF